MKDTIKSIIDEISPVLLSEGIYDPGIFKAVFMAGGSGSGKTYTQTRSMPNAAFGLKVVNMDSALEHIARKSGIPLDMVKQTSIEREEWDKIAEKAWKMSQIKLKRLIDGRVGLIIDATGADYKKVTDQAEILKSLGYDTYMVFVNATKPIAGIRNQERERTIEPEIAGRNWENAQRNIGKYQEYFNRGDKNNFMIVDNNKRGNEEMLDRVFKQIGKFVQRPIESRIAKEWIKQELEAHKRI